MAIFGSICLYPNGGIRYIDALFLASGSATQSGLNTVDINRLSTWQQLVLYFIPMITNPITINSFVVFLRLYWFEKRFQHIAREAKKGRRSIAKTLSKARTDERDIGSEEMGVNGRDIVVMHNTTRQNGMTNDATVPADLEEFVAREKAMNQQEQQRTSSETGGTSKGPSSGSESSKPGEEMPKAQTQIKFADHVKRSNGEADEPLRMPVQRSHEEHIAILERQRKQDDGAVLRIPGPRDADAGRNPEQVQEESPIEPMTTRRSSTFGSRRGSTNTQHLNGDDHTLGGTTKPRNITIEEPTRSPTAEHVADDAVAAKHTLGALRLRKPRLFKSSTEKMHDDHENHLKHSRSRATTFQTIRSALSSSKDDPMPYLSWEPTVGRNSAFVDLSESQREELGGIEYRSLKSLALILTLYFFGFSLLAVIGLLPWIVNSPKYIGIVNADGQGKIWWGLFMGTYGSDLIS
jgi:hypothetical protein